MIENGRANAAYKMCNEQRNSMREYRTRVKDLPSMIQVNGLAPAIAFLYSKRRGAYRRLYSDIESWLISQNLIQANLMESLTRMDAMRYRQVTVEVMALLGWMKRFVDGIEPDRG